MFLSNTVLIVLSMSFVAILQLWLISWPLTNDVSDTSEIAILLLIGLTIQLFGRLILRINTDEKVTSSEENNEAQIQEQE